MKRKHDKRQSWIVMLVMLIVPIAMCLVIVVALALGFVQISSVQSNIPPEQIAAVNTYDSISLMIAMLGVAVSVWVGLNIYNVLSKEELNELLEQAERASEIVEDVYTEVLISKLRLLPADRIENCLASKLRNVERFPCDILECMISLEDKFNYAYAMYVAGASVGYAGNETKELEKTKKEYEDRGVLSKKQKKFLDGYITLRKADLSFFGLQYDKDIYNKKRKKLTKEEELDRKKKFGRKIIEQYKKVLNKLFDTKNLSTLCSPKKYLTEECQGIALMANNICAAYLTIIPTTSPKTEDLEEAVNAGKVAISFYAGVQPRIQAVFERNLGVALERLGRSDQGYEKYVNEAFYHYYKSYGLDQKNWKIHHCLGSWYRMQFYEKYGWGSDFSKSAEAPKNLTGTDRDRGIALLRKAAYWYWLEQNNKGGQVVGWLVAVKECLKKLGVTDKELTDESLCKEADRCRKEWDEIEASMSSGAN